MKQVVAIQIIEEKINRKISTGTFNNWYRKYKDSEGTTIFTIKSNK